uniref:phosphopantetheine-binding protein n=1 Tax=Nonomuraea sp. LPB2021202275-12-8 TaxID=3120159 RepID=UPI00300C6EA8
MTELTDPTGLFSSYGLEVVSALPADRECVAPSFLRGSSQRDVGVSGERLGQIAEICGTSLGTVFVAAVQALLLAEPADSVLTGVGVTDGGAPGLRAVLTEVSDDLTLQGLCVVTAEALAAHAPTDQLPRVAVLPVGAGAEFLRPGDQAALGDEIACVEIAFVFEQAGGRWQVSCEYDEDLYSPSAVATHLDRLTWLLDAIAGDRAQQVQDLRAGPRYAEPFAGPAPLVFVEPRSETERVLAGIWAEFLGVDRVGATDDFFALGGHSILAVQVVARVREVFGVELGLDDLFEAPTLADSAARIDAAERGAGRVALVAREPDA